MEHGETPRPVAHPRSWTCPRAPKLRRRPQLLPRNLVRLEICGETMPALSPEAFEQLGQAVAEAMEQVRT